MAVFEEPIAVGKIRKIIRDIFFDNVKLSYGCTEPVAVGLSVAIAKDYLKGELNRIEILMDRNTYKNGLEVGIPGTHLHGFEIAAALAYLIGKSEFGLEVFKNVTGEIVSKAYEMKDKVSVKYENEIRLHIKTKVVGDNEVLVEITDSHDNVSRIVVDGNEILNTQSSVNFKKEGAKAVTLNEIFDYVQKPDEDVLELVRKATEYNIEISEIGLNTDGNFGRVLDGIPRYVAAGVDQRMSGALLPVMTVAGSGNQGISCIVPVSKVADDLGVSQEKKEKAVLLSILVTIYVKAYTGTLTPICGAGSIASAGASAGIVFLNDGSYEQIKNAINNVLATLFGMTCDGAKRSCSLKASIGTQMALNSAKLALNGTNIPCGNGFAARDVEETIRRLEVLTNSLRNFDEDVINFIGHC
ncbi:L-cysteine desulfidase [Fervidobacterium changbaicum]|nr:L-serine ammonia-lyase, iron-sulfur-dependent, subunit alpha [Fervidobacterium changbaicum]SDH07362.1 L-cysteine desulfidase [Fervidobacterium changbaicum]